MVKMWATQHVIINGLLWMGITMVTINLIDLDHIPTDDTPWSIKKLLNAEATKDPSGLQRGIFHNPKLIIGFFYLNMAVSGATLGLITHYILDDILWHSTI